MTEKEAFAYIEDLQRILTQHRFHFSKEFTEANGMALKALELQIPKKIRIEKTIFERGCFMDSYCPCCNEKVEDFGYEPFYCDQCGQRLDWSDGDD